MIKYYGAINVTREKEILYECVAHVTYSLDTNQRAKVEKGEGLYMGQSRCIYINKYSNAAARLTCTENNFEQIEQRKY